MDSIIPNCDPAMELFLRSLQSDMKAFAGLVAANKKLEAENKTLRSQVQKLELLCEKHKMRNYLYQ